MRCRAPDGSEWASPFEFRVFCALQKAGYAVSKCGPDCAMGYTTPVKQGRCASCGSCSIVQERTYTPDLAVRIFAPVIGERIIFLETKGYFTGPKRNLFRAARQSNPQADIRLVVSSNHAVTKGKTRLSDWAKRFKIPFHVWDGQLPEEWLK